MASTVAVPAALPRHVGIIMDGNRRWARAQGLSELKGHQQGLESFRAITQHAFERGIECLTFYTFSTENWNRPSFEVSYLMDLFRGSFSKLLDEVRKQGAKLRFLGQIEAFSPDIQGMVKNAEAETAQNHGLHLNFAFNYGGQQEIVAAAQRLVADGFKPEEVTAEALRQRLYGAELPDLDLVIRTSGEQRTSGFMLWQAAYAELYFTPKMWPEFTPEVFDEALEAYCQRERRFGT